MQGMEAPLTSSDLEALNTKMQQHGQIELLRHWESLSDTEQKALYIDLGALDFAHLRRIFDASNQVDTTGLKHVQPAKDVITLADMSDAQRKQWNATGLQLIAEVGFAQRFASSWQSHVACRANWASCSWLVGREPASAAPAQRDATTSSSHPTSPSSNCRPSASSPCSAWLLSKLMGKGLQCGAVVWIEIRQRPTATAQQQADAVVCDDERNHGRRH